MKPLTVRVFTGLILPLLLAQCVRMPQSAQAPDPETLSPSVQEDEEYIGLGSVWTTVMKSDRTFTMSKAEELSTSPVLEILGTYEAFSSGFYKLRTENAEGSEKSKALSESFAFSVPGAFLITKAFDDDGSVAKETQLQPARTRACPAQSQKFNWMQSNAGSTTNMENQKRWGNLTLPAEGGEVTGYKWNLAGELTNKARTFFAVSDCEKGLWRTKKDKLSGLTSYGFVMMTTSGISLIDPKVNDENDGTQLRQIAVPVDESVDATSLNEKTFVGIVFKNINQGVMYAVEIRFDKSGVGSFAYLDDVEKGKLGAEEGTLTVVSAGTGEQQGFLKLESAGDFEGTGSLWAVVSTDLRASRRTFFYATGVLDPSVKRGVSILAIQKE